MRIGKAFSIAAIVSCLYSAPASATYLVDNITMPNPTSVHITSDGVNGEFLMGQVNFFSKGILIFQGYCVDLGIGDEIGLGIQAIPVVYDIGTLNSDGLGRPISLTVAERISKLASTSIDTNALDEQGTQKAIWTMLPDNATVTTNNVGLDIIALVKESFPADPTLGRPDTFFPVNTGQMMVGNIMVAVPEPSTWAMLILGLLGIGAAVSLGRRQASLRA